MRHLAGWVFGVIALFACGFLVGGCGQADVPKKAAGTVTILTSFHPMHIMALNIAGGVPGVTVQNLTQPTAGCLHDYQLSPQELAALADADILVVNGAGMESFLAKAISQYPQLKLVEASRGLDLILAKPAGEDGAANPHVWVSPAGAMAQVRKIADGLARADPTHAAQYHANANAYLTRLEALGKKMHAELDALPNRRIVTMHEAFPYFAREFNLAIASVIEREPGSEPSAGELAETITAVRASGIKAVFAEPQYPAKAAEAIARETGATVYTLDPAVTGPAEADSYLKTMNQNLDVLRRALK